MSGRDGVLALIAGILSAILMALLLIYLTSHAHPVHAAAQHTVSSSSAPPVHLDPFSTGTVPPTLPPAVRATAAAPTARSSVAPRKPVPAPQARTVRPPHPVVSSAAARPAPTAIAPVPPEPKPAPSSSSGTCVLTICLPILP